MLTKAQSLTKVPYHTDSLEQFGYFRFLLGTLLWCHILNRWCSIQLICTFYCTRFMMSHIFKQGKCNFISEFLDLRNYLWDVLKLCLIRWKNWWRYLWLLSNKFWTQLPVLLKQSQNLHNTLKQYSVLYVVSS